MKFTRTVFLSVSIGVVLLFAGVLMANRSNQDVLFRALGNLAEVVHLVETEYVDELNQEALSMSLDAGLVEPLDRSAAVLPSDRIDEYLEFVGSAAALRSRSRHATGFGLGVLCPPGLARRDCGARSGGKSSSSSRASTAAGGRCGRSGWT